MAGLEEDLGPATDRMLPVQQEWWNHLMDMPMSQWPQRLKDYMTEHLSEWHCGDEICELVARWVLEQRD